MEGLISMAQQECCDVSPKQLIRPSIRDGLFNRKQSLEKQLVDINAAIEALDKNPEITKVLELVGKASRY